MIWLVGVPVRPEDARSLVTTLLADGSKDAIDAARVVAGCLDAHKITVPLTNKERMAILAVLEDPPPGLGELRGALVRQVPAFDRATDDRSSGL